MKNRIQKHKLIKRKKDKLLQREAEFVSSIEENTLKPQSLQPQNNWNCVIKSCKSEKLSGTK